jgi:hypothetical protein
VAIQQGSIVTSFNAIGMTLASFSSSSRPNEGLVGFTSNTVTIRNKNVITVYNERECPGQLGRSRVHMRV